MISHISINLLLIADIDERQASSVSIIDHKGALEMSAKKFHCRRIYIHMYNIYKYICIYLYFEICIYVYAEL